jgi:putative CocE/NonD family hydrolase
MAPGWFDGDQPGAMFYWRGMQAGSPARGKQFLLVGPWLHVQTWRGGERRVGEMELGPESVVDNKAIHLAFFDWCLKGAAPRFDFPRARVYVTGLNRWKDFDAYPPKQVAERPLYLHSGGRANSISGDGRLTWDPPAAEPPDRYTYDPKQPVPTDPDDEPSGRDQRAVERRDDVLVFTGDPLTAPVEIIGSVTATVHAATDARDTDFLAKLVDVYPDGRAVLLGSRIGIRRARYRHGYEREELLAPNQVEAYRIELFDIAHSFQPGHRIRVEISSSAAPMYNPNQNTGNPVATDTEWKVARQTVYHDRARASAITLPVVSRAAVP